MSSYSHIEIETKFRNKLLSIYPEENILFEYKLDISTPTSMFGITIQVDAVLVNDLGTPIAIFECKIVQTQSDFDLLKNSGKDILIALHKNKGFPVFLVVVSVDDNGNIKHYYIYRLHPETEELEQIGWPDLGIKEKSMIEEKQKKNLNIIVIKSWVIILMGIGLLVLDSELLLKFLPISYKITSERMWFMFFLAILFYIPNISEISIANFSLKLINSKEEEKDSEK